MPTIQDPINFQPNQDALSKWLATRKHKYSNVQIGLFNTIGYKSDKNWVRFVVVLELFALFLTLYFGFVKKSTIAGFSGFLVAIIASVLFITLDIVGAILHHQKVGEKQRVKNKIAGAKTVAERTAAEFELSKIGNSSKILGTMLIFISSIIKIVSMLLLSKKMTITILVAIVIMFFIIVYIHLRHTGYWLAEYRTMKEFKKQYIAHALAKDKKLPPVNNATTHNPINFNLTENLYGSSGSILKANESLKIDQHCITYINQEDGEYSFQLKCIGVLTDDQISRFVTGQAEVNQEKLRRICIEGIQLTLV